MKIYISKPGIICAAGKSLNELFINVTNGNQKIEKIRTLNEKDFFVAKIDDKILEKSTGRFDMRIIQIEENALLQIENDINFSKQKFGSNRIGVCVGSCDNGTELSIKNHRDFFENNVFSENYSLEMQGADYVSTFIAEKYEITGPVNSFSTACSSSASAIIKGAELILADICDAVIVGGIDIASETVLLGFDSLEAISDEITNPFSKNRKGITIGEAGAFFILSKEHLNQNEPKVLLKGWGESSDAYHLTSPNPSGEGAKQAIENALKSANISINDVDYLNLHGTGTKLNDSMESKAVDCVFGEKKIPVSSTKSITGHTLGAAAALELAICYSVLTQNEQNIKLPIQIWDFLYDDELPKLNFVNKNTTVQKINNCLSNSFAFGGANACLVIGM